MTLFQHAPLTKDIILSCNMLTKDIILSCNMLTKDIILSCNMLTKDIILSCNIVTGMQWFDMVNMCYNQVP